jgi:hypothetical protein
VLVTPKLNLAIQSHSIDSQLPIDSKDGWKATSRRISADLVSKIDFANIFADEQPPDSIFHLMWKHWEHDERLLFGLVVIDSQLVTSVRES